MNSKTITISGIEVTFTASAATPRLYRACFRRDIFQDLAKVASDIESTDGLPPMDVFEDIAYVMAGVPARTPAKTVEEWLNEFDEVMAIYEALSTIFELWGINTATLNESKKNEEPEEK